MRFFFSFFPMLLAISVALYAGTNNLPTEHAGTVQLQHVNKFKTALSGDAVPRDSSGNVVNLSAALGSVTYEWLKAFVKSGYWSLGDIKPHHSYNGAAPIEEGWMLCDGRTITLSNYDTEHGSGHWNTYVGSSALVNKYLPNFTGRFPVGVSATSQDGSVAITAVGNSGSTINLQHSHTVNAHNHQWYLHVGNQGISDVTYNSSGNTISVDGNALKNPGGSWGMSTADGSGSYSTVVMGTNAYTANATPGTSNSLSTSQSIEPDSIETQYYMRIIQ